MKRTNNLWLLLVVLLPGSFSSVAAQKPELDAVLKNLGFPKGSAVRSVTTRDNTLLIDFTPETVKNGITDSDLEALADALRRLPDKSGIGNTRMTVGDRDLSSFAPPSPFVPTAEAPAPTAAAGALLGKKIVLSPGHGWYYKPAWSLQRSYYFGIVEDFMNQEMIQYLYNLLVNAGATVWVTREMDKTAGNCTTLYNFAGLERTAPNKPWWQMAALYYAVRMGAPSSVYDNGNTTDYNRDIAARPLYANWRGADIMVSLHNNGYDGTATGTETLYDNANGYTVTDAANEYGSQYLAQKIQAKVVAQIRANYNASWANRGAKGFAGSYGENRRATRPACLIEVAFVDRLDPDSNALQDEKFRLLVAKGMYEGICDYFHVTPTYNANVSAPLGTWKANPMTRTWAVKLGGSIEAAPSSAGGWVYAGTTAGTAHGVAATVESGYTPGTLRWTYPATGNLGASILARPTVYNDSVYFVTVNGKLLALNRFSGGLRWSVTVPNAGNLVSSPAATADGKVVIGSDNGRLYSYAQSNGALLKSFPSGTPFGAINGSVAIPANQEVWVTSADGKVRRITADLNTMLWESTAGTGINTSPMVLADNNTVYFSNTSNTIYALNASNGSLALGWEGPVTYTKVIGGSPWASGADDLLVAGLENHQIVGLRASDGINPGDFPLRPYGVREYPGGAVVWNGVIYIGGADGRFLALRRTSGSADPGSGWRVFDSSTQGLPGQFLGSPCLTGTTADDRVVVGCTNSYLYAFPL
ncbi:MAG: PQQ-binding-like beta-propeller repeat protein [Armatimonadetes bacterium]|jgi:outer membrane protein assembly factor BamB/N-acetylmuramoyl-L-alanine amidase|nr:PQQ-binding-like beta-propeller repeat protein [Armatimonadota bacterium]